MSEGWFYNSEFIPQARQARNKTGESFWIHPLFWDIIS